MIFFYVPAQRSLHACPPDSFADGNKSMQPRWKSEYSKIGVVEQKASELKRKRMREQKLN